MAGEDPLYLRWVKTLACAAPGSPEGCSGVTEAHHAGFRPLSMKAHDRTAVPLCTVDHRAFHDGAGKFKGWTRAQRRDWAQSVIEATQAKANARRALPEWA